MRVAAPPELRRWTITMVLAMTFAGLGEGACAHDRGRGATSTAAPGPAPIASPSSPEAFCARLARANDVALAAVPSGHPVVGAWRNAAGCHVSPTDAWGLSLDSLHAAEPDASEIWGRWSLRHIHFLPAGASREDAPFAPDTLSSALAVGDREQPVAVGQSNLKWSDYGRVMPAATTFFDFDGDGDLEAVVVVETAEDSESGIDRSTRRGRVWTAHAGIQLYPPARDTVVEDAHDVDGDGRPDLITRGPYIALATITCGSQDLYPVSGPALMAHALPGGTFATADPVAADFARRECSKPPRPVMVREPSTVAAASGIGFAASARNVACARLWGAATRPLVAAIAAACRQPPGATCQPCDDAALLERWVDVAPPLLLRSPEAAPK